MKKIALSLMTLGLLQSTAVMLSVPYYAMDIIKGLVLAGALALTYFQRRT